MKQCLIKQYICQLVNKAWPARHSKRFTYTVSVLVAVRNPEIKPFFLLHAASFTVTNPAQDTAQLILKRMVCSKKRQLAHQRNCLNNNNSEHPTATALLNTLHDHLPPTTTDT